MGDVRPMGMSCHGGKIEGSELRVEGQKNAARDADYFGLRLVSFVEVAFFLVGVLVPGFVGRLAGLAVGLLLGGRRSFLLGSGGFLFAAGAGAAFAPFFLSSFAAPALPLAGTGSGFGGGAGGSGTLRFGSRSLHFGSISSSSLRAFGP